MPRHINCYTYSADFTQSFYCFTDYPLKPKPAVCKWAGLKRFLFGIEYFDTNTLLFVCVSVTNT